jgi:hypothetical protein
MMAVLVTEEENMRKFRDSKRSIEEEKEREIELNANLKMTSHKCDTFWIVRLIQPPQIAESVCLPFAR